VSCRPFAVLLLWPSAFGAVDEETATPAAGQVTDRVGTDFCCLER
jgi:hypothetical protein